MAASDTGARVLICLLGAAVAAAGCATREFRPAADVSFEDRLLATLPPDATYQGAVFSPDGRRVAVAVQIGGRGRILLGDRIVGDGLDAVFFPAFCSDGRTLAYVARKGKKERLVVGEDASGEFDKVWDLVCAPAGGRVTAIAWREDVRQAVLLTGGVGRSFEEGQRFEDVRDPLFSPDGVRLAHRAKGGEKVFVVVDGSKGPEFDDTWDVTFSPDGRRVAYAARNGREEFVVVDARTGEPCDGVLYPAFSPDGGRVAFAARTGPAWRVVVDGKPGAACDFVGRPVFSPDGRRVAYGARKGRNWDLVTGGVDAGGFDEVGEPVFRSGGPGLACKVRTGAGESILWYAAEGEAPHPAPVFNFVGRPVPAPGGSPPACSARDGDRWCIVVDNERSPSFDFAWPPVFSVDGQRVAFGAKAGGELWWKVVDIHRHP